VDTTDASLSLEHAADRDHTVHVPKGIRRRRLGRLRGHIVWLVDGERVRNELHCDFTCGGSDARYAYCAKNEIWIDDCLGPLDATATLLHEYIECEFMKREGMTYEQAHDIATAHEVAFREKLVAERPKRVNVKRVERELP
jgi:hypothetical protein